MRKLIFGINTTIDGCVDHTKGLPDSEVHEYFTHLTREADVLVYGRKTYELMVPFWPDIAKSPEGKPKEMSDFAKAFDSVPRIVVFSRTLNQPAGTKTTLLKTGLHEEIQKLKQQPGKSILTGGVEIPTELMKLGLVDEFHLVVHSTVAGKGRRLFDEMKIEENFDFKLIESKTFKSGAVALRYAKNARKS